MTSIRCWAVVPASGVGSRMGNAVPKQYLALAGRMVIEHALAPLLEHPLIAGVAVAIRSEDAWWPRLRFATDKPMLRAVGGAERSQSVRNALQVLQACAAAHDWVLVHDAVRPCLSRADLDVLLNRLAQDPIGGVLATPVRDTMKRADAAGRVIETVERAGLWHALTPQMFRLELLTAALDRVAERGLAVTDEASAVEALGLAPRLIEGRADNIKITRPEDLALAEFYLQRAGRAG